MSSNVFERLWKLEVSANQLVLEGKRKPEAFAEVLQQFVWGNNLPDINWQMTYRKLGMEREYEAALKTLTIPSENPQLWIGLMLKLSICNEVVAAFRRDGVQVYTYREDLDAGLEVHASRGTIKCPYIVGFKRAVEADDENKNKSANFLAEENHKGMMLPERLVWGYGYWVTAKEHLDVKSITLCSGSRYSDGGVPSVDCGPGSRGVYVVYCNPDDAYDVLRSRSVVSQRILPA